MQRHVVTRSATREARSPLPSLPVALVREIFCSLPADAKGRAACVDRTWCAFMMDAALWTRLDMSCAALGVLPTDAVLLGAAARARGRLASLVTSEPYTNAGASLITSDAVLHVLRANARTLTELHFSQEVSWVDSAFLQQLRAAAPNLRALAVSLSGVDVADARAVLRGEGEHAVLRLEDLEVLNCAVSVQQFLSLMADVASHETLAALSLWHAPLDNLIALDALADVALAHRMQRLQLLGRSKLGAASAPALTRIAAGGWLTSLTINHCEFVEPLREAGALLGVLISANHPNLTELDVGYCSLGDVGLAPLMAALQHNTHLTSLDCADNDVSEAFVRDVLLPAVRANNTLQSLSVCSTLDSDEDDDEDYYGHEEYLRLAEAAVNER
jgi:hypothetical protein